MSPAPVRGWLPLRWIGLAPANARALRHAALALWLPALLPFAIGPLRECDHCVRQYLLWAPVGPGILPAVAFTQGTLGMVAVAAVTTLLLLAGLTAGIRALGRHWPWAALVAFALCGAEAVAFSRALRM
ncbi:MAG: hypothetical protein AB7O97_22745 [Planctomycetota bacterium]